MIRKFLFLFVLCLPSLAFGQRFNTVIDRSQYPDQVVGNTIPLNSGFAILKFRTQPRGSYQEVLDASIIPSYTFSDGDTWGGLGWYSAFGDIGSVGSYQDVYVVIDSSTIFCRANRITTVALNSIQEILTKKNLGTVEQRAAYIASFKLNNVSIIDTSKIMESIVSMLGPWANIGIGIAIALFGIDLGTRKSKKIAGQAAKEARAAERREINKEIRQDPVAAQFRTHLGNLSSVIRDTYGLHGTDSRTRREARALFEQAAKDYAAYKKYRGWTS